MDEHTKYLNQAQASLDKIVKVFHDADTAKVGYRKTRDELTHDKRYTDEYRKTELGKLRDLCNKRLAALREEADAAQANLTEAVEHLTEHLDLNDVRLTSAIALATAQGSAAMPLAAQQAIVEPFIRNQDALKALLPVFNGAGMVIAGASAAGAIANIQRAETFLNVLPNEVHEATQDIEGGFGTSRLSGKLHAFADMYNLRVEETPAEVAEYALREAMGLLDR